MNAIAPEFMVTPMMALFREAPEIDQIPISLSPMGRLGGPEENAPAFVFPVSDEVAFIYGVIRSDDGGYTAG